MKIINKTKYSDLELKGLIDFSIDPKLKIKSITFKYMNFLYDRLNNNFCYGSFETDDRTITIFVTKKDSKKLNKVRHWFSWNDHYIINMGYIPYRCFSFAEDLVNILCHESIHARQLSKFGVNIFKMRLKNCEREACKNGIRKMREYRKITYKNYIDVLPKWII